MPDEMHLGPAMRALTDKQRDFVLAMAADPFGNPTKWARAAGYSDTAGGAKVRGHLCMQSPKVEAAIAEFARGQLNTLGPLLATAAMLRIVKNPKHPKHLRAAEMLLNRTGFHEKTEHHVTVDHGAAGDLMQRLRDAASILGIDPARLIGVNTPEPLKVIEGTAEKVDG